MLPQFSSKRACVGFAAVFFLLAASALGQSGNQPGKQYDLIGVNARLVHQLSSKTARPGESVVATTDHPTKTPEGIDLPKGTELLGTVLRAESSHDGGPSSITLLFNQARLKDGKKVPVKVVLLGAFPANEHAMAEVGDQTMGPAPRHISSREKILQEPGLLNHVAMKSAVHAHSSATFMRAKGDFRLMQGTFFQIGIAPRESNMTAAGAS